MNQAPLKRIKEIHAALMEAKTIPLYGHIPDFPWERVSQEIATLLHLADFTLQPKTTQFLIPEEILSGLGTDVIVVALELSPLIGQAFWVMNREDVTKITALALTASQASKGFSSSKFQEGFYNFLAIQAVHAIEALVPFEDLSIKMGKTSPIPQEEALCIDVEIRHSKHTLWGRLVCPSSFHLTFKTHFITQTEDLLSSAASKNIDVSLRLEVGQTELTLSELKKVSVGDFILLDRCTFDPKTHKGTVTLCLHQTPLLRAKIKDNSLKIIDDVFYSEEQNVMNPQTPHEDENPEENLNDEEFLPLETQEAEEEEEEHLWNAENDQVDQEEQSIPIEQIPVLLSVEVGRLRINLDKLLQLSAGNILELPVKPEQGVDLMVGGKKIAKAELIRLGEMLGVKILTMGG